MTSSVAHSGWERGRRSSRARWPARASLVALAAVVALALLIGEAARQRELRLDGSDGGGTAAAPAPSPGAVAAPDPSPGAATAPDPSPGAATAPDPSPGAATAPDPDAGDRGDPATGSDAADAEAQRRFSLDGTAPAEAPATRTGVAFLELDDPLARAVEVLGEPETSAPDIDATRTHVWSLPGEAVLAVTAEERPPHLIAGLSVDIPEGSPVRLPLYGGILPGQSSLGEVVQRWGEDYEPATHPGDDFAIRYVTCAGAFPVVVKFDTAGSVRTAAPPLDEVVTSALVAYADADPGTAGCPQEPAPALSS